VEELISMDAEMVLERRAGPGEFSVAKSRSDMDTPVDSKGMFDGEIV
jgi:hypothetical protein